jgi:hypothetical protein
MADETVSVSSSEPLVSSDSNSYLDWGSIIGGIVLASAISIVLLAFGSAIGLSFSATSVSAKGLAIGAGVGAALWFIWVQVSSFMAGAYLTGRMRKRRSDSTEHESEVRDGSHGLLVWAGCVLIGSFIALSGASSVVSSIGGISKAATSVMATGAASTADLSNGNAMQYYSDMLLRGAAAGGSTPNRADRTAVVTEINTILAKAALPTGNLAPSPDDKTYLAQLVSQQTGMTPELANTRVNETLAKIDAAKAEVAKAAETARRVGIIAAFLLAASLLVSAAAAYWAATIGGNHRDQGAVFTGFFRRVGQ